MNMAATWAGLATRPAASLTRHSLAVVLAGGRGSRLGDLTAQRAKPAVPFGGSARIIDFALSNALNSGIRRVGIATQYKAFSLIQHLHRAWSFLRPERNESLDILPASQRVAEDRWYQGTADAVYQNLDILSTYDCEQVIVLAGDHVYKMDYSVILAEQAESGADVVIACLEVPREEASAFGVVDVDEHDRIVRFIEKPNDPPGMPDKPDRSFVSMGIYVFRTDFLFDLLRQDAENEDSGHDFGHDLIPYIVRHGHARVHRFSRSCVKSTPRADDYWRDVGTLDTYFEANLDLTNVLPQFDLYDADWPIWTSMEMLPPAKFVHDVDGRRGYATGSLVSPGCIVSGATVRNSLLSSRVRVKSYAQLDRVVALPGTVIGQQARLRDVILDGDLVVPRGLVVGEDPAHDAERFHRTEKGVCLITREMLERLE